MQRERASGNEFDFIDWLRANAGPAPADLLVGPGDDCAVIAHGGDKLLLKVDSVLEGTHFSLMPHDSPEARQHAGLANPSSRHAGLATPEQVGYKVMARTVSDIAAMGGVPRFALVAAALPRGAGALLREGLMVGLRRAAAPWRVAIAGGDTKSWGPGRGLALSVSMLGEMGGLAPVLRSGGRAGDALFVTGELGGSILGRHLAFSPRVEEGRWLAGFGAHAMIDLSDGLSGDLWHIVKESATGAILDAASIPVAAAAREVAARDNSAALDHALHDGEDFELLFAVAPEDAGRLRETWPFETRLTRIGELTVFDRRERVVGDGVLLRTPHGVLAPLPIRAYEHEL